MSTGGAWLDPLIEEIAVADTAERAEIFARLCEELGSEEAGRRWWAAFGATDASPT